MISRKQLNRFLPTIVLILSIAAFWFLKPFTFNEEKMHEAQIYHAKVLAVVSEEQVQRQSGRPGSLNQVLSVRVQLPTGPKIVEATNDFIAIKKGNSIFVQGQALGTSSEVFYVVDINRQQGLVWIALAFVVLTVLVGGVIGVHALIGLVFSFAVIFAGILPLILRGQDPVLVSLAGSLAILLVTIYLSHGLNPKSAAAITGIALTLGIVALVTKLVMPHLYFSGFSAEEALYLQNQSPQALDFVGLVAASIIIAAIGVLDDVAVTQASIVYGLAEHGALRGRRLFKRAMAIGRDHISAVINTLVLAYTGAALPLLLLLMLQQFPAGFILNGEIVAEEIVRTLVSTSALVLAVPLTTLVAVYFIHRRAPMVREH